MFKASEFKTETISGISLKVLNVSSLATSTSRIFELRVMRERLGKSLNIFGSVIRMDGS